MVRAWLVVACAGCGRLAFDGTLDAQTGSGTDTAVDTAAITSAQLLHDYRLFESFADELGGPAASPLGGTLPSGGGYLFPANQGLVLANVVPAQAYSLDLTFQFDTVTGYRKIVDFKATSTDEGLYATDSKLQFVEVAITGCPGNSCYTSTANVDAAVVVQITLTRAADGTTAGYIGKIQQFQFVDTMNVGNFDQANQAANLFVDDTYTNGNESSGGVVHRVRVFDGPLSAADVGLL